LIDVVNVTEIFDVVTNKSRHCTLINAETTVNTATHTTWATFNKARFFQFHTTVSTLQYTDVYSIISET